MSEVRLTKKQREIYDFIMKSTREQGYPPSVREIGEAVGLRSPSTVHAHLKSLDALGLIDRESRKTRAIRIPGASPEESSVRSIPIIGRVAAGQPVLAYSEIEGEIPFDVGRSAGEFFALRVRGDSMIDAGILDGDLVVVRRQEDAVHGEIVVAAIDGEVTVKRFYRQRGEIWLMPENPAYHPISAVGASIVGRVVGLTRRY
ncbi:MAG: transcriptional repressor LexA [Clostridiaceae bacterium]|nr:transcriptional repressor LexA [Clostridiaceae bacterium]MDY3070759.1 transcriptional repressor LexA [Eubacteriales bacterium]